MEITTVTSSVRDILSTMSLLGLSMGAIATAALLIWVCARAKSAHPILARLWVKVRGSQNVQDPEIQSLMDDLDKLSWFQFMTAIYPRTTKNAKALISWCSANNVALSEVRACGFWFDIDRPSLRHGKAPGKAWLTLAGLAAPILAAGGLAGAAMLPSSALMQSKQSSQWFWLSTTKASPLGATKSNILTREDCSNEKSNLSEKTGFTSHEAHSLCQFFISEDASVQVSNNVNSQRICFGILAISLLAFGRWLSIEYSYVAAAQRLAKYLGEQEEEKLSDPGRNSAKHIGRQKQAQNLDKQVLKSESSTTTAS
ncbi:DUF6216 family protein [Paucibacter sp. KBW04]|uniref:DUF6216 family protein n=1 Tax=Paucibacter sp. KBW04 TaxID=2153361 RepID=UPI000F56D8C7|nr:DUF6216 family protein [Paucibacter sp. KBW04]